MKTIKKSASVKVMLSYNYNHFETSISLENEKGLTNKDIDEARKDCNRLCDRAVLQYQKAKDNEGKRANQKWERKRLEDEVSDILNKSKKERTPEEKAKVKALEDFEYYVIYDYDEEYD